MNVGDLCTIWMGEGEPHEPKGYLLGFVVERAERNGVMSYRVFWNDLVHDSSWYHERDIELSQVRWKKKRG
jgi:hypothetical protein